MLAASAGNRLIDLVSVPLITTFHSDFDVQAVTAIANCILKST